MITIVIQRPDDFNDETQKFIYYDPVKLRMEHSLVSLSKWESLYKKPFLNNMGKNEQEMYDYLEAMILDDDYPEDILSYLTQEQADKITAYIDDPQTATWFYEDPNAKKSTEIVTAEVIYQWMVAYEIDFQCQDWHLNRLITLVRVCSEKHPDAKPRKKSRGELAEERRRLNRQRREAMGTSG